MRLYLSVIKLSPEKPFRGELFFIPRFMAIMVIVSSRPTGSVLEIRGRFSRQDDEVYGGADHTQGRGNTA